MTKKPPKVTRTAIRRSAQSKGEVVLSRRGNTLTVAVGGHFHDGQITALVETLMLRSSGFARYVERTWHQRREWYPDEHPIKALHNAHFFAEAAMNVAYRAVGRRRWS